MKVLYDLFLFVASVILLYCSMKLVEIVLEKLL